ncbi:SusC/RagA family TonB-linked outer membrane protein [Flavobacterium johnsoniae]|uniref:SusC-like TonB-dependent receptor n=1 Tax=Flavobacterium johnsoniae (strain ATCC 17061 / DSM 2064 / JCM 8514 / BCRC 14874 / CCUG 350202 / NBRC 14942 / NCIMB 11054 / UW101) TaxID=376686 RepID=A5FM73_FLAJ1|nr:SusC/RagA family TonB-linked outer membrane protein [Flavobacterium johnsoniae]ABQ03700.1 SusC-like TonB-dependent receptor [Flavobacterium johnsoniae UW101]OXG03224.1 SusC/RagA family TonB-linked outer membrane protein [Flavobacterium johnsoniae UW101]WQG79438.1 SusC/RagA family TonB-linked outer membrane protein [Flavobacterium johnsoniae UW101]SHK00142.1 TonB-linked outer membrane protein, SusC/RagA family [Flavobacterium johnsoniae]
MKTKLISLALIGGMIFSANAKEAAIKMHVFQQNSNQIEITGQVIGQDDGMPIAGATIYAKSSTKIATITDETGKFRLNVPENEKQIVISYMGYGTLEFNLNQKTNLVISLKPAENVLDQVLVTALGVKKSTKAVAYAVTELKGTEFTKAKETNIANALVGKIAGVNVSSTATGPNGSSRVVIRGNGSLNGNNQPMYVVNDLPIDNTQLNLPGIGNGPGSTRINVDRGDGTSVINPDDIKTITVLKGGTAAALYGANAANGVILIQTKRGAAQKGIGVDYNTSFTFETPSIFPDWQYEYGSGSNGKKPINQSEAIAAGRWSWGAKMDGSDVVQFDGVARPYSPQKNNIKNFYETGTTFINSIALSGGNEKAAGRLSFSNTDNQSVVPNSDFNRKSVNIAGNVNMTDWLKFDVVAQYNNEKSNNRVTVSDAEANPNWGTYMIANTVDIRNLAPGYDENGVEEAWNPVAVATNPYFVVNKIKNKDTKNRFIGMLNVKLNFTPELFLQGRIGQDYTDYDFFGYIPKTTLNNPVGYAQGQKAKLSNLNTEAILNYTKKNIYGNFSLNALAGVNSRTTLRDETRFEGSNFVLDDFYALSNLSTLTYTYPYGKTKTNSVYGAVDLDYKNVVFLNFTGRQDWFSTLSKDNNTVFYPSVGTSIIVSDIVKMPEFVSFAKLRTSWAQVGGATPDPYALNQSYSMIQGGHNGQQLQGPTSSRVPNSTLSPLTSTTFEVGTDLVFFNNRLNLDFAWYNRATTNDIVETTISNASGANTALLNLGKMRNKGVEFLLSSKIINSENFSWDASFNGSYNENTVEALTDQLSSITMATSVNGYVTITSDVGHPYSIIKGYRPRKDANGNTVYNVSGGSATIAQGPLEELGQGVHPWGAGISNEFKYKNISFSFLIDGKFGGSLYSGTDLYGTRMGLTKLTLEGHESGLPIKGVDTNGNPVDMVIAPENLRTYYDGLRNISSTFVYDASFIKLRQIILGYQLPIEKIKGLSKLQGASISFVARNLFILYKKTPNVDPESVFSAGNAQGVEQFGVPKTRSFGLSLNVKF